MAPDKNTGTKRTGLLPGLLLTALFGAAVLVLGWKITDYLADEQTSLSYWDELQNSVVITDAGPPGKKTEHKPIPDAETQDTNTKHKPITDAQEQVTESPETEEPDGPVIPSAIDFDSLHAISGNAVAWIFAPDTQINYVIAQSDDNDYYVHRLLDGRTATGGTLFADYRCGAGFTDWNTVIYGHKMKNGTMFGELVRYRDDPSYYGEHPLMYLYIPGKRYTLELIAGYTTDIYDAVYSLPAAREERDAILARAVERSTFRSGVTAGDEDRLVTLSTCSYSSGTVRYVVVGRLVEE